MGEGDVESGIDQGIKALSSMRFAPVAEDEGGALHSTKRQQPEWKVEEGDNRNLPDDDRWFRERGLGNSGEER